MHQDNFIRLTEEELQTQRLARNVVKRDSFILFAVMMVLLVLWMIFVLGQPQKLTLLRLFVPLLVIYMFLKLASNWRGWAALHAYKVRCPHCHRILAEKVYIFKNSSHNCPHCGKRALAPIKQLTQAE